MKKYVELIELLEKIFGKGAVSRTIGTRSNVVRFPKGKQPVDPTRGELDVEGTAAKNPDLVQIIENSIEDRMGDITKMNDQELLTYTANVRRLANFKEPPPLPEADIVKFGSGQEIKGKGLEELIEKQGTINPPTTIAGQLETQGKKLEKVGEDLKEITEPKSVIDDIMKDYGDFDKFMQSSQKTGYVRATVRQIMREDILSGKLKLPKELQDQVMQGTGEPIDIWRKVYGEGSLEQIDSLADDLGQFRTEEEAAKFARSKYQIEPKAEPVDESKTYEELEDIFKKGTEEPEGKANGGRIGFNKGKKVMSQIDKLIEQLNKKTKGKKSMESVDPKTGEVTVPKRPIRRAEEPTGMTTMDPEPDIIDEKAITKTKQQTKSRQLTNDEIVDYEEQIGRNSEEWLSEGTVDEAEKALKRSKAEEASMFQQYKKGKLDPTPGEQTEARMKFLQKKMEEASELKDRRLITPKEVEELMELETMFKTATDSEGKPIPGAFSFNDPEIKEGMEKAMAEAKKRGDDMRAMGLDPASGRDYDKYIEIKTKSGDKDFNKYFDDLEIKTKFKNVISDDLLEQILIDDNPQRKAEVVAAIEQGLKMQEKGMSPQEIVDILKNAPRTKQAEGGIAGLL